MNKRANLYFAALLGAMSPLCTVSALAAQSNSTIATATQQQNSCTGTVKDATGEPIIGATIRIEGKTGGTVTDLDGNFTLNNIEKGAKLTITYVGYKSQTLTWSGSPLNITLQDDANMLEETVVIGYGTVKKADLAGSVAVLDSKSFKDQPVARVEDALNGRMSGVHVRLTEEQADALSDLYHFSGIPTYFVVNKEGKITYQTTSFPGVDKLREVLKSE